MIKLNDKMIELNENIKRKIFEDIGQASMCWEKVDKAGIFDSIEACKIAEDLCNFIAIEIDKLQE
jgi:hypothetical protein